MAFTVYYAADIDRAPLKSLQFAVLGFGNQGQAHARNLRDSGCRVLIAQRPGTPNHDAAIQHGFAPVSIAQAVGLADVLIFGLPDEAMGNLFAAEIAPILRPGQTLGFIHGFAIRFGAIVSPKEVDVIMVAPKGPGTLVRQAFERGGGVPCLFAVHQDASGKARDTALAWGAGIGGGKGGMIETTFDVECESDLFGEQTVLCGGVVELMKAGFDILVEAGYPPEIAYFECVHEVKQIVDLQYTLGIAGMRSRISSTAAYGGLKVGPRLIDERVKEKMKSILGEIRSGNFARQWLQECAGGKAAFSSMLRAEREHPSEPAGRIVRELAQKASGS